MRRRAAIAAGLALALLAMRPAAAETVALRIARPVDLVALPLLVMEREHLIERVADAMGLGGVTVSWMTPGSADPAAALQGGESDFAAIGLAPFLRAADATAGAAPEVRALAALVQRPYVLVTRNRAIRTIRDFAAGDRIAVPALKVSGPALMLEMAAAQEWGPEHYDKLDPLLVARPDAAAATDLLAGKGGIDAHFSRTPYADDELGDPAVHRVMDSFDIAGPHTAAVLATTTRFHAAHPMLCAAILSALQNADDIIKKSPGEAAEIFAAMLKGEEVPLEDLTDMIGDPDLAYTAAPTGVMRLADIMRRSGAVKRPVRSWRALFLPEAKDLAGN